MSSTPAGTRYLRRKHPILGGINALFAESTQQFIPADLEQLVAEYIRTVEYAGVGTPL